MVHCPLPEVKALHKKFVCGVGYTREPYLGGAYLGLEGHYPSTLPRHTPLLVHTKFF